MTEQRTYINLEKNQIEKVLALFEEMDETRGLTAIEKFINIIFKDALDKVENSW